MIEMKKFKNKKKILISTKNKFKSKKIFVIMQNFRKN